MKSAGTPASGKYSLSHSRFPSRIFELVFASAPDGILVVGEGGEIMLANDMAAEMFGYAMKEFLGLTVESLMPRRDREQHRVHRSDYAREPRTRGMGTDLNLVGRRKDGKDFPVDIMLSPLQLGDEKVVICTMRDITEQRSNQLACQNLLRQLQEEQQKLKRLHGLLPICAWCKKIRDDDGYWRRLEEYFQEHADVDFTHGICPDCSEKQAARRREARELTSSQE
jgi:PAS domain S-box-containing protein